MFIEILLSTVTLFSSPWVWLILSASVLYAAGNYLDELLLSKYEQEVGTLVIISTLFGVVIALIFLILAKVNNVSIILEHPVLFMALFVGVLEALWIIPYLYATERSGAIIAGPLFQAVPVFALLFESLLGTVPPLLQIVGALVIVAGGILLSIEKEESEDSMNGYKVNWVTALLMSTSSVIVALIYVLFRDAALSSNFFAVGFWTGIGMLITGAIIYIVWKPYREQFNTFCKSANPKAIGIQLINEVFDACGVYMTNLANTLGPSVMVVTAFNATQPIAVGLFGLLLSYFGISTVSTDTTQKNGWILLGSGIILISVGIVILAVSGYE